MELFKELQEQLGNERNLVTFDVVKPGFIRKPRKSVYLPTFMGQFETVVSHTDECLQITIGENVYYLLEMNVLYRKEVTIKVNTERKKWLFFTITHTEKLSNEAKIIKLCEAANEITPIKYQRYFASRTGKTYYGFILKAYYIHKNGQSEETTIRDFSKLQKSYKKAVLRSKQAQLEDKISKLFIIAE